MVKTYVPEHGYEERLMGRINELDQYARYHGHLINRSKLKKDYADYIKNRDKHNWSENWIRLTKIVNDLETQIWGDKLTKFFPSTETLYIPKPSEFAYGGIDERDEAYLWEDYKERKKKSVKPKPKRKVTKKKSCGCK
jgi:hypothetical protein